MSTTTFTPQAAGRRRRGLHQQLTGAAARAWRTFELWHSRTSERRTLRELSPWLLDDVGLSPRRPRAEAARRHWLA